MANHKSAIKAHRKSQERATRNSSIRSRFKTFIKKVDVCIANNSYEDARKALQVAESELMKAVSKGVLKLNTASRKVSRLTKRVKSLEPSSTTATA